MTSKFPSEIKRMTERRAIIILALLLMIPAFIPGLSAPLEDLSLTASAAVSSRMSKQPDAVIVAVDDKSISEMGEWPWSRTVIAKFVDRLRLMNAGPVAIEAPLVKDLGISELRTPQPKEGTAGLNLVTGYMFYPNLSDLPRNYEDGEGRISSLAAELALPAMPADDSPLRAMAGIDASAVQGGGRRSPRDGFSNIFPDTDGVVRKQPLAVRLRHRIYPSLPLSVQAASMGVTPLVTEDPSGKPAGVTIGNERIPTSQDAALTIDFRGPPGWFPRVSAADVMTGKMSPDTIAGRIILLGATTSDIADIYKTPVGQMPGIEITAHVVDNLRRTTHILSLIDTPFAGASVLLAAAVFLIFIIRLSVASRIGWSALLLAAAWGAFFAAFSFYGVILPAMHFSMAMAIFLVASLCWQFFMVRIPNRIRASSFSMRIPEKTLRKAFAVPGIFDSRGAARNIAALALDLRGYGSITLNMQPDKLCAFMRGYRKLVSGILLEEGAFVDSWAGDECRAAFGAILKNQDYSLSACRAAFRLIKAVAAAREEVARRYDVEPPRIAVGICSGESAIGDLGPRGAHNFGITGGAMENACTLRALNRAYRTNVLVDDATRSAAENHFVFRPLDPVIIHGNALPALIHEMIGETGVILQQMDIYMKAREAYLGGDFDSAVSLFTRLIHEYPHDGAAQVFLKRARSLQANPPKGSWHGVWGRN